MSTIRFFITPMLVFTALFGSCTNHNTANDNTMPEQPIIGIAPPELDTNKHTEIVFCLDATGSMSGLIGTAKEKIWSIVSELAQDQSLVSLKLGMVFYRDRGDSFITQFIPLTDDLDSVYTELLNISAAGGGDTPESVNQALNESVTKMAWSEDSRVYKTIFVVGDCPPHMDYQDDVKYTESCKIAAQKGITINTIKLGNGCQDAIPHFKSMAECSNGVFLQLDQDASDIVIATPYDEDINAVSKKIDQSRMYYGNESEKRDNNFKKDNSLMVYDNGTVTANSDRADYKSSSAGQKAWMGNKEIINDYANKQVDIKDIPEEELPEELKNKTIEEKTALLEKLNAQREVYKKELAELSKKRQEFIDQERAKRGEESSFSKEVVDIMNEQAKEK